jgi:hypothetical protein
MNGKDNNHDKQNINWSKPRLEKQQWGQHEVWSSSGALKWDKYKKKVTSILDTLQVVKMRNWLLKFQCEMAEDFHYII